MKLNVERDPQWSQHRCQNASSIYAKSDSEEDNVNHALFMFYDFEEHNCYFHDFVIYIYRCIYLYPQPGGFAQGFIGALNFEM